MNIKTLVMYVTAVLLTLGIMGYVLVRVITHVETPPPKKSRNDIRHHFHVLLNAKVAEMTKCVHAIADLAPPTQLHVGNIVSLIMF